MKQFRFIWIVLGLLSLSMMLGGVSADAKWFGKQEKPADAAEDPVRTYQPPAINGLQLYCEPFRQEAALLAHKPRLLRIFYQPRRSWLIGQHTKCKANLMQQEKDYLEHVDVQQAPSLPKLKSDAPATETPSLTKEAPHAGQ